MAIELYIDRYINMTETKICPEHNIEMICIPTCAGNRYECPVLGCEMYAWKKGAPGDPKTMKMRIEAHKEFDMLWKTGLMTRAKAYRWLANRMSMRIESAHIKYFDAEQCDRLIKLSREMKEKLMKFYRIND